MIAESDAAFDVPAVQLMLMEFNVVETEEQVRDGGPI